MVYTTHSHIDKWKVHGARQEKVFTQHHFTNEDSTQKKRSEKRFETALVRSFRQTRTYEKTSRAICDNKQFLKLFGFVFCLNFLLLFICAILSQSEKSTSFEREIGRCITRKMFLNAFLVLSLSISVFPCASIVLCEFYVFCAREMKQFLLFVSSFLLCRNWRVHICFICSRKKKKRFANAGWYIFIVYIFRSKFRIVRISFVRFFSSSFVSVVLLSPTLLFSVCFPIFYLSSFFFCCCFCQLFTIFHSIQFPFGDCRYQK